jgi:hypothetical protein
LDPVNTNLLSSLALRCVGLSREEYVRSYPQPFLVQTSFGPSDPHEVGFFTSSSDGASQQGIREALVKLPVFPLIKRSGASFEGMISVGRAPANDVYLNLPNISKFHAYFKRVGARWQLTDYNSMNGTFVAGEQLVANVARTLESSVQVSFDRNPVFLFKQPEEMYDYMEQIQSLI